MRRFVHAYFLLSALCFAALLSGATWKSERRTFATEHYVIHTDLEDDLARDLATELEYCYAEFTRRLSMFENSERTSDPEPFNVYLFRRHADYMAFTGGEFPNTGGIFISRKRALAVYLEDQGREAMRRTLRHEAFHQFAHQRIGRGLPVWVNEGLAQLFEESIRVGDQLRIGQVTPDRLRQLQHDLKTGRLIDFERLITLDDESWARTLADRGRAATQYTQAWAMVHFLVYAVDADGQPLYRDRFNNMLQAIAGGRSGWGAFRDHFGTNFDGFRAKFDMYVQGLAPTPDAKAVDDQRTLAELLVLLRQRGIRFDTLDSFRQHVIERRYRLECRRDEVVWSTDPDVSVYFRDVRGRSLSGRQIYFQPDPLGEMPSLVRRPGDGLIYRTRFYRLDERLMHETTCDYEPSVGSLTRTE